MDKKFNRIDDVNDIFADSPINVVSDDVDEELDTPIISIDMDEVDRESQRMATLITERLSGYYFSEEYITEHPYIPTKIMMEMNNIRRLLKMLSVNEKAQDSIIMGISFNAGKGSLYASLTALQNSMLNIQKQLNDLTKELEEIFQKMQDECDKTFKEKDKETNEDGTITVRGSREFINRLNELQRGGKLKTDNKIKIEETPIEAPDKPILDEGEREMTESDIFEQHT